MLSLLLDQHLSGEICEQIIAHRSEIPIQSLYDWRQGAFVGAADSLVLRSAAEDQLTLVTYDRRSIPPILSEWGVSGISHGGVVFVDNFTIAPNDIGRLVRALVYFWDREHASDWTNRVGFLPAPSHPR